MIREIEISQNRISYGALGPIRSQLGYRNARTLTRDGVSAVPGSGEFHTRYDRPVLVNFSRQFYRENGLYSGIINRAVLNVVSARGFGFQARTGSDSWNDKCEELYREWGQKPEIRGLWAWPALQRLVLREALLTGDSLVLPLADNKDHRLQVIESEQVTGKDTPEGVVTGEFNEPTGFIVNGYRDGQVKVDPNKKAIPAKDCFYLAILDRASQTRGMPVLQGVFPMLHRINDTCDSEALAYQLLSRIALSIESDAAGNLAGLTATDDPSKAGADNAGEMTTKIQELDYALIFHTKPGDRIAGVERNIPGKDFTNTIRTFLRLLGLPVGMPLELVFLDFSQTSFSSVRAVLEQAFNAFQELQEFLLYGLHVPLHHWLVDQWIADGKLRGIKKPDRYKAEWFPPPFPWLNQLEEAQAWGAKLDRGLSTYAAACKSVSADSQAVLEQRRREVLKAIQTAQEIEAEVHEKVPWQIFCGLRLPGADKPVADAKPTEGEPRQPKTAPSGEPEPAPATAPGEGEE